MLAVVLSAVLTAPVVPLANVAPVAPPAATAGPAGAAARELVVLVLVDAMRPDHLGAYGYARPTSPTIDALAATGRRFTRVYTNAPWTRPSTASFLTGLNASRHRTETAKSKLPAEVPTLAARLKQAGWATSGFCANGNGGSLAGLNRDFGLFEDPTNTYHKAVRGETYNGLPTGPFTVSRALEHLRRSRAQREFVFIFLVDPHDPYQAPPELERLFLGDFKGTIRRHALWENKNRYPPDERFSMMAVYDAGIRYADQALGTFVQGLRELGVYENTTLLVAADHGEAFGEHGFYLHAHQFWDEVVRIPLVVHGPRFAPGVDGRLAQAIDVTATIAALTGADATGLAGRSLQGDPSPGAEVISEYNEFGIHRQAIVGDRYKVVWQRPADAAWFDREVPSRDEFPSVSFDRDVVQAFDLVADPGEKQDLGAALPAEAQALLARLRQFVEGASAGVAAAP